MKVGDLVTYHDQIFVVVEEDATYADYVFVKNIVTGNTTLFPRGFLTKLETDKK